MPLIDPGDWNGQQCHQGTCCTNRIEKIKDWDHILQTLNHSLTDFLVAIAIIHFLPKTYSTLKTILLSTPEDKLSSNVIINHILVEEKS